MFFNLLADMYRQCDLNNKHIICMIYNYTQSVEAIDWKEIVGLC